MARIIAYFRPARRQVCQETCNPLIFINFKSDAFVKKNQPRVGTFAARGRLSIDWTYEQTEGAGMDTNRTSQSPEGHTENQNRPQTRSMRDVFIFGVLIVIGIGVAAMLFTKS